MDNLGLGGSAPASSPIDDLARWDSMANGIQMRLVRGAPTSPRASENADTHLR